MAKNKRECPALGQTIPSARCGEERGVIIDCPGDCVFNPFATCNYDHFGELEERLLMKIIGRFAEERGQLAVERLHRELARYQKNPFLAHAKYGLAHFLERDADGRTLPERWGAARFAGLNNDEIRLLRGMAHTKLSVIEVHRQLDDCTLEVVDLLDADPQPFVVADRHLARHWVRFATFLAWTYETPHYRRLAGGLISVNKVDEFSPSDFLRNIINHLGGPADLTEAREWLTENIEEVADAVLDDDDYFTEAVPTEPEELRAHYVEFADDPHPDLDDRTPREAAVDPEMRPRLVGLMKGCLSELDHQAWRAGRVLDIDWLLRELKLEEILLPPPAWREPPEDGLTDDDEFDDDERDEFAEDDESSEVANLLRPNSRFEPEDWDYDPTVVELMPDGRVLSDEEIESRMESLNAAAHDEGEHLIQALHDWPDLQEVCYELAEGFSQDEILVLLVHALQCAAILHPERPAGLRINPGRLQHFWDEEQRRLLEIMKKHPGGPPDDIFTGESPQPVLTSRMAAVVMEVSKKLPKKQRRREPRIELSPASALTIISFIRATIRELCHWPVR